MHKVFVQQIFAGAFVGLGCGAIGALFVTLLGLADGLRERMPELVLGLPLLGLVLGSIWARWGVVLGRGSDPIIDALCDGGPHLRRRTLPMAMLGTVAAHLCGASVGQEGTALQLGAALGDAVHRHARLSAQLRRTCLLAGVAGGFGAVFGTPVAGALFALEFSVAHAMQTRLLVAVSTAALVGQVTAWACHIEHVAYPQPEAVAASPHLVAYWLLLAAAAAAVSGTFIALTDAIRHLSQRLVPQLPWRMAAGGALFVLVTRCFDATIYLGGGLAMVVRALGDEGPGPLDWAIKLVLTALSLGVGFVGGEVTPLFFMGSTLGHTLASTCGVPVAISAAVGMAAVLSSATKTPIAMAVMAAELTGLHVLPHALLTCACATALSGQRRIYAAQRGHLTDGAEGAGTA